MLLYTLMPIRGAVNYVFRNWRLPSSALFLGIPDVRVSLWFICKKLAAFRIVFPASFVVTFTVIRHRAYSKLSADDHTRDGSRCGLPAREMLSSQLVNTRGIPSEAQES